MAVGGPTAEGADWEGDGGPDAERKQLDAELFAAECTLAGEVHQIESLARDNGRKVEELRDLEEDAKKLQERNEHHFSMLQDEHTSTKQELAHRLSVLHEQLMQLNLKHERYREAARLSEIAGAEVEVVLATMERRTKTHAEEVHAIRQEMLHLAQGLESTFRTSLKDLEGTYRRKAFHALGSEAKAGMRANKTLRDEMTLQNLGLTALDARHSKQNRGTGDLKNEMRKLKESEMKHEATLAELHRDAKAMDSFIADVKETKARIASIEQSLWTQLRKDGVPVRFTLAEIREMSTAELKEASRLRELKDVWQRRIEELIRAILPQHQEARQALMPITPDSNGVPSSSALIRTAARGSCLARTGLEVSKAAPHVTTRQDRHVGWGAEKASHTSITSKAKRVEDSWHTRVKKITEGWTDVDDLGYKLRAAKSVISLESTNQPGKKHHALMPRRSASTPALLRRASGPSTQLQEQPFCDPLGSNLTGFWKASVEGKPNTWIASDEDPWMRKRRIERAVRRRDAQMRAKAVPMNSGRADYTSSSCS